MIDNRSKNTTNSLLNLLSMGLFTIYWCQISLCLKNLTIKEVNVEWKKEAWCV